jgi:two-component system response regulator AtoC
MPYRLLLAEDSATTRDQMRTLLEADGNFQVDTVSDGATALEALVRGHYSLFITDLKMPGKDGMQLVEEVRRRQLPVTVVVMTGFGSIDHAVKAIRLGAYDFLTKPIDIDHLRLVLERAIRERNLREEVHLLRNKLDTQEAFHNILSKSPRMQAIFETISNIAPTTSTVLIVGETGTGKEMIARAIHDASASYRGGDLVAVNCAALPKDLLESEMFGHEKGAFTSAAAQRKGRFELANNGTLFLDEIGDLSPSMQVKLLRVLQERKFERVGGTETIEVDVRVIAATHRDLESLVRKSKFREDLYYRLNVVRLDVPPLRERMEDLPLLANHFAVKYARPGDPPRPISPSAMEKLLQHSWPGNIRQLENAVERACVTVRGPSIEPEHLPPEILSPQAQVFGPTVDLNRPLPDLVREAVADLEKQYLRRALRKTRGNIGKCARLAGLSRRSISAKLAEYQIDKDEFKKIAEK